METDERHTRSASPRTLGGRYELGELLGSGGMAEVRRARDGRLGREVAVKLLTATGAADRSRRRRIEREARALASLNHQNIVAVFDYGEEPLEEGGVLPYLVMEVVEGPDLHGYLASGGRLDQAEATDILRAVLSAVGRAHDEGIVHGDIKPANVLMSEHGPKVGDFGVARILGEETGTTTVAATPSYAAPEVLRGSKPTAASDLYSVACLGFEMLSGHAPYAGSNAWEVATKHMEAPLPSVRVRRPEIGVAIDEAIRRGMQKNPRLRQPSAAAFAAALESPAPTAPVAHPTARPPTPQPTEELPRPPRRERWGERMSRVTIAAGAVAALGAVLLLLGVLGLRSDATSVPDVRGQATDAAGAALERAGLVVSGVSYAPIATGEPGLVLRTIPAAGEEIEPGGDVHMVSGLLAATPEPPKVKDEEADEDGDDRGRGNRRRGGRD